MREIRSIVESNIPPNRTDVAWLYNSTLKFFINGSWKEIGKEDNTSPINLPIIKEDNLEIIIEESKIGVKNSINKVLENKIKVCARIIISRTNLVTNDKYHVIYTRMDSDDNIFINVGLNEKNKLSASVLYLDTEHHMITFD